MTPNEELFKEFYNHEKLLVADMDISKLREHREKLSQIAFEAKARLLAADDEDRERKAKHSSQTRQWLVSSDADKQLSSDAINAVDARKKRMNKVDKLRQQLKDSGIDDETIKIMMANVERNATEKNLKAVTFERPVTEQAVIVVQKEKPAENQEVKEVDFSKLSFLKK